VHVLYACARPHVTDAKVMLLIRWPVCICVCACVLYVCARPHVIDAKVMLLIRGPVCVCVCV